MENHNVFAGAFVDRSGERRKDPDWLEEAIGSSKSLFLPVWRDKCLIAGDPPTAARLARTDVAEQLDAAAEIVFLGLFRGRPAFAFDADPEAAAPFADMGEFHDLRYLGSVLAPDEANLVAHARALILWHRSQLFCGVCGSRADADAGGNARLCGNPGCGKVLFPRVDPAIIVLVADGDRCLLGRQASWPEDRYSTIAGFVEPGESLEDAVRREVYEETNIEVGEVRYHSSQPWPFPSSLMLGFMASALSNAIALNDAELEDAAWFSREDLVSGKPKLPYRISIARRLIDDWLASPD